MPNISEETQAEVLNALAQGSVHMQAATLVLKAAEQKLDEQATRIKTLEAQLAWHEQREPLIGAIVRRVCLEPEEVCVFDVRDKAVELRDWMIANQEPGGGE